MCRYNSGMAPTLTIRNVSDDTHRTLAARAAARGQSLQEYLLHEVTDLAARPSVEEVLVRARDRTNRTAPGIGTDAVLEALRHDRQR